MASTPVSFLQVDRISKSFGDLVLFENLSFGIAEGQRVALIAKNGTGKTTLLNILAGNEDYDAGQVVYRNGIRVSYLKQDPGFPPESTVLEACFLSDSAVVQTLARYEAYMERETAGKKQPDEENLEEIMHLMDYHKAWDFENQVKQVLSQLKIRDFDQPVSQLSGGQVKRVALANALIAKPDLLILDEPTNHLDLEMIEWLEGFLTRSGTTLLMVTHDRYFLDRVCNLILEIDQNKLFSYSGNYSYYLEKHQERIEVFNTELDRANNLYRKELEWMRRQPQARATKAKARIEAFGDIEKKVAQKRREDSIQLDVKSSYLGSKIFEAKYVSKAYGDVKLLDNFYYNFARFDKVGIVGKNGTGKSTFLKMLMGEVAPDSGSFDVGETVVFAYYSQSGLQFNEQMKVIDAVRDIAEEVDLGGGKKLSASQFLQHFLFTPETQHNYIHKLSGGEKRRLYLCTVLMCNPNFLVLDEPTNDLDILTLNILEDYLANFKGCVLVVSHDRYFMDKIVEHLLVFEGDAHIRDFPGNYTQYRLDRDLQVAAETQQIKAAQERPVRNTVDSGTSSENKPRKLSYKETRELEQLEKEIDALEAEKTKLEGDLSNGSAAASDIETWAKRLSQVHQALDSKSDRWLELQERL
ncbi:MAG: ABC-F family ATP-binding cassette domain-containing protein [Bacteroidales bacterium]|nr:ABC-F family ATP-binding cassette domain-containing protein [Bacteroidales bacterium]MDD3167402.1 ABC-F family ATP-binding cassette domain-containing protein [Bacteroidales bacterium]MDD4770624.1 ABC-F family ATP-binding cassette domain-containing protein [Bacteroidales bacterium]HKL91694.1 ABC-F family ATP-binding cassette domain-containing protein [Bacteroidales bacterium]